MQLRRKVGFAALLMWLCLTRAAVASDSNQYAEWETYTTADGLPSASVFSVAIDREGIWLGTARGLALVAKGRVARVYTSDDGLANNAVTSIALDRSTGDLWIATLGGLSHYSGGVFHSYTNLSSGLANDLVYDVAVEGGYIWAATAAGISRFNTHTGEWAIFSEKNSPMRESLSTALAVTNGRLYGAIWGGGLVQYDMPTEKWAVQTSAPDPLRTDWSRDFVTDLAYDAGRETLWIATHSGLTSYDGRRWHTYLPTNSGLPSDYVNVVRVHGRRIWIGTDKGLSTFDPDRKSWTTYRRHDALNEGEVVLENRGGAVTVVRTTAIADNYVHDVTFDKDDVWVATASGLSHGISGQQCRGRRCNRRGGTQGIERNASRSRRQAEVDTEHRNQPHTLPQGHSVLSASDIENSINIGFWGPVENNPESAYGLAILHGVQLAIEEANASGGYKPNGAGRAIPYVLKLHNDSPLWGASTTEPVSMHFDEHVVAAIGPIDEASSRNMLLVGSRLQLPIVNTGTTDALGSDARIPWLLHSFPDNELQASALAEYVVERMRLKRVGVLRVESRYGRSGAQEFYEHARRIGTSPSLELTYNAGERDFSVQLRKLKAAGVDGLIIWGEAEQAGLVLKQMRASRMLQPVFGSSRICSSQLVQIAGPAAEGLVAICPVDPAAMSPAWQGFQKKYRHRFNESADAYAAYAYDGTNLLISAIEQAGLDRVAIMRKLREQADKKYWGVSGCMHFSRDLENIAEVKLARVEGGRFVSWSREEKVETSPCESR